MKGEERAYAKAPVGKFGAHLTWGILAAMVLLWAFGELAEGLLNQEIGAFDNAITTFVHGYLSRGLTQAAIIITHLGSAGPELAVTLLIGGLLVFKFRQVWDAVILVSALVGGWVLNITLKAIFHRTRPEIQHLVDVGGYSFPSGHAMVALSFYGMLGYLIWLNLRKRSKPAWYIIVLTVLVIGTIGASRVYLGVHYPSDVLAGFAAGGVWLMACILALHVIRYYKSNE